MDNSAFGKDKIKKLIYLLLIFGAFAVLHNFVPQGLDQAGWDGFLVLFVAVFLWLTEAVPMAVTAIFVLFFGAWVGFAAEEEILAGFSGTGTFFLLGAMIIGQIFAKVGLGKRLSLYVLPMLGNKSKMVLLSVMLGTCIISMFLADIPTALIFFGLCTPLLEKNGMNAVTMSLLKSICGVEISFVQWSIVGVPVAIASTIVAWLFFCTIFKPEMDVVKGLDSLKEDRKNIGPLRGDELKFAIVFSVMIVMWFIPKYTGIDMYMTAWAGIFVMSMPGMNMVDWKEVNSKVDWSAFMICGTATALATMVANLGTGEWLSGILADLFLSKVAGMGILILLLVINLMMMVGHYPMPQGVSLAGLCLPVVGALALNLGLNPIVVCLPVCMSTSMLLLVPIDPTCYTTYSGGFWKIKDMMGTGIVITIGYVLINSVWTALIASVGLLG